MISRGFVGPYWAVFSARFRALLQYRAAALAGLGTQFFWGLIRMMIFVAFYQSATDAATGAVPMSLAETVSYVWLGQALLLVMPWNIDAEVQEKIRTGAVAYELVRPIDLYAMWFARAVAMRTAPVMLRCVPMLAIALAVGWIGPPASMPALVAALVSVLLAVVLSAAITVALETSLFWTVSGEGVLRLFPGVVLIGSGLVVPLPLYPDWARALLEWLPFAGLMDTPFRLYMGHFPPDAVLPRLAHQVGWTLALIALGRWLLLRGTRRVVIQGG